MALSSKERRRKFTVSIGESLVAAVDTMATSLALTRSRAVEEALEMWLSKKDEEQGS